MKKITLLKKLISLILRNGIFLKLKINLSVGLVGSNLPSILSLVLELLRKHILFQELMKSVVSLIEEVLMIFLQRNPVICTYIYIYCVENCGLLPGVAQALVMMISALLWPI